MVDFRWDPAIRNRNYRDLASQYESYIRRNERIYDTTRGYQDTVLYKEKRPPRPYTCYILGQEEYICIYIKKGVMIRRFWAWGNKGEATEK